MLRFGNTIFIFCSHVASTAAGNYGVPVVVNGFNYGRASGMAPRARYYIITCSKMYQEKNISICIPVT